LRLHVLSDLHLEVDPGFRPPPTAADVLILDGDIAPGTDGMTAFADHGTPVIYVPGNHEFYHSDVAAMHEHLRTHAATAGIHFLERDELILNGVRFLGATLWTDFDLHGPTRRAEAFAESKRYVRDFRRIRHGDRLLTPEDTIDFHRAALAWLAARLDEPFAGSTVVITHHAPHPASIHPRWRDNPVNPAFVSDLTRLMGKAELWIHGHTHDSFDYTLNGTRVVCNPKGYRDENRSFRPDLTVTV
jgi:predicted phosphodiesterase